MAGLSHPLATCGLAASLLALGPGCAAHGTREDVEAVRAVLATRSELDLVDLDRGPGEPPGDVVARLLSEPLDVERAVRVAIANNRSLRAALAELGIARGELVQAGLLPNPVIDAEARFPEADEPVQIDVGVEVNVTATVLAPLRTELASARMQVARLRTAGAVLDLAYRARIAFLRYQAAERRAELVRAATEALEASVAAATALRDAGNYRDLDVAMEEAAYEEARLEVARAELEALDARQRVDVWLGLAGSGLEWQLASPLPDPDDAPPLPDDDDELERHGIEASLELAVARAEIEALGRAAGLARTEGLFPDLMIGFHAELDEQHWEYGPEMAIALPIFSQGQGRVIAREAELDAARERYVGLAVAVRAAVRGAGNRARTTEALAQRYRDVLIPARARVFELTLEQYNAMQVDVFRLLDARRGQIETEMRYVDVLREHWEARATLAQVLAGRLAGTIGRGSVGELERSRAAARRDEETL